MSNAKPIRTITIVPALPPAIEALREIAYNVCWSWNPETIELFRRLDRDLWESSRHNPVLMLGAIEQEKLAEASANDAFLAHLERVKERLSGYLSTDRHWFGRNCGPVTEGCSIAYFSAEFGLTESLSIFAGGLGMLAGDHLKSASDLGVPVTGVGLLYQQGYFTQYLNQSGWQQEEYDDNDFHNLPLTLITGADGLPLMVEVQYPGRPVYAQIWRVQVGRVPLYLLDTNIDRNQRPEDRDITDQLYGGDKEMRIQQEILLGIGGCRALRAMGIVPGVYHINEGHSAFLVLERVRDLMETRKLSFAEARVLASSGTVFTTHTPVDAGHDYFAPELMDRYFGDYIRALGISRDEFLSFGRWPGQGEFCMTALALRFACHANGVSKLHGQVSREMWQKLWPELPVNEVPIGHITNGVHFPSWTSLEMKRLYDRYLGPDWAAEPAHDGVWNGAQAIPPEELWRTHELRRERLISWARRHVRQQRIRRGAPQFEIDEAAEILDPDALTIGFARRFATYKRATLILRDLPRLKRILTDAERPVQLIFAGKAHPRDEGGKELIRQVTQLSRDPEMGRRIVFLEDYDMAVARYLVQGVDVWLNNPARPLEASGTSGMKAAANGALNLSTLDGWWDEVWRDSDNPRTIGWAIGKGEDYADANYGDQVEAEALYDLLERDVVPTFYDRGSDRVPRRWIERMKASIGSLCPFVNTHRMVSDYFHQFYLDAHRNFSVLERDGAGRARALSAWLDHVRREWAGVRIETIEQASGPQHSVGGNLHVEARVRLGGLGVDDVTVELYMGRLDSAREIANGTAVAMRPAGGNPQSGHTFTVDAPCRRSGLYGYTVRIRPKHADLFVPAVSGLIRWADTHAWMERKEAVTV
ncbi:MAG TPA: alpha-glucan family phosphorylase [Verrucomicrobiae bacterium]|nr:alpha-glucan family phosphorylase [Verrucomicrobiae bacterium]